MKKIAQRTVFLVLSLLALCFVCFVYGDKTKNENEEAEIQETQKEEDTEKMVYLGQFDLTAYCPCPVCCDVWAENRPTDKNGKEIVYGASGEVLKSGLSVAVDPDLIPYGTGLIINGKEYIAHDCGGAIKGNKIDIYLTSHKEALEFGRKSGEVYVIEVA